MKTTQLGIELGSRHLRVTAPNKEEFLEHLCHKAGLPANCWKDSTTQFQVYEAIMWEE